MTRCLALLVLGCLGLAAAQPGLAGSSLASFVLGVGGEVVADAWNPLRVVTRDLPSSTLTLTIDVGTLKDGEEIIDISHQLGGGAGVRAFETVLFVPPFRSLAWRVSTTDRIVASGSLGSRDSDARPLVLLLTERKATALSSEARAAWPQARVVEVLPADLPATPAAYDGVGAVVVGHPAPPIDALVAAAVAGADVRLVNPAGPPAALAGLLAGPGAAAPLGAGRLTGGVAAGATDAPRAGARPGALLLAALREPLVSAPPPTRMAVVLIGSVAYALVALALLRFGAAQGLLAAVLLAVLGGLGAWYAVRPGAPRYDGELAVGLVGGELALLHEAQERMTLPPATLDFAPGSAVTPPRAYKADDAGVHLSSAAWRATLVTLPPRAVSAPLRVADGTLENLSAAALQGVYVVGLGAQPDLAPGAAWRLRPGELEAYPALHARLYSAVLPLLHAGMLVATSGCDGPGHCVVWLADSHEADGARR